MNENQASITVAVDPTNPGQFFACCGLLELADRLWPGAEGWFAEGGREFRIALTKKQGTLGDLLREFAKASVNSSLTDEELKRLGSLMSLEKSKLTEQSKLEKERLSRAWKEESLHVGAPFQIHLDWWRGSDGKRTPLKTWAAKEFVVHKLRPLVSALQRVGDSEDSHKEVLFSEGEVDCVPFYFDASLTGQSTARDVGFGLYDLRTVIRESGATKPATECLAFIGLQRCQPSVTKDGSLTYAVWNRPLSAAVISGHACGRLRHLCFHRFSFTLVDRTEYMKAFSSATTLKGD